MFYTPEPPLYVVVEVPPFATNKQLAGLINEHLPNPEHHLEAVVEVPKGGTHTTYWEEHRHDESGRLISIDIMLSDDRAGTGDWSDMPEVVTYKSFLGGKYLVAPCDSLNGVHTFWLRCVDQIDSIDGKPIHPYTDIYVTL